LRCVFLPKTNSLSSSLLPRRRRDQLGRRRRGRQRRRRGMTSNPDNPTQAHTSRPSPAATRRASYRSAAPPSVSLSPLTTRSSSSTRLPQLDTSYQHHLVHAVLSDRPSQSEAYRAWRRESKDRIAPAGRGPAAPGAATPTKRKGKGKAVTFVVGAPSSGSGDDGDAELDDTPDNDDDDREVRERLRAAFLSQRELKLEDYIKAQVCRLAPVLSFSARREATTRGTTGRRDKTGGATTPKSLALLPSPLSLLLAHTRPGFMTPF
jgi:hypothetical protein